MSGQKQSFRFKLPWLPSLVAAPALPTRPSSSQRNQKVAPLSPADTVVAVPIRMQNEQPVEETSVHSIDQPLPQAPAVPPETESQSLLLNIIPQPTIPGAALDPPLPKTSSGQLQPLGISPAQLKQQPLTRAAMLPQRIDSQLPSSGNEAQSFRAPAELLSLSLGAEPHTPLRRNSDPLQPLSISPVYPIQPSAHAMALPESIKPSPTTKFQLIESQPWSPSARGEIPPASPRAESKPASHSYGTTWSDKSSHLLSSSQKSIETPAKSQPRKPSRIGTSTRANFQPSSTTRLVTPKPSSSSGASTRYTSKEPLLFRAVTQPRTTSQPSSRAFKSPRIHSKKPLSSLPGNAHQTSSQLESSSPSIAQSSSSPSSPTSSSNTIDELTTSSKPLHVQNSSQPFVCQEYERNPRLQGVQGVVPETTKTPTSKVIDDIEPHSPIYLVSDRKNSKPSPASEKKQVIAVRFKEHPSSKDATEETNEEDGYRALESVGNKGKQKFPSSRVASSSHEVDKKTYVAHNTGKGNGQVPTSTHNEIKDDVSSLIRKLSLGKLGQPGREEPVSIITISGENKGATMHLGSESSGEGKTILNYAPKANSEDKTETLCDGEGTSTTMKLEDPLTTFERRNNAYVNSNIQSINNSMLLNSSVTERNPGVHVGTMDQRNVKKDVSESDVTHKGQGEVAAAGKVTYQPTVRRRCLRGLLMESSDSEPDNPSKPRRHGCRYACKDKRKLEF